ncbi:hypothetical protein TNCV_1790981 [Trichonephila clavipes]|nr:hypothetical protein TNCV_1790981 [Trichonephila clavipes]
MKDENPEMILGHCVIHRENLVAKNITPVLNEVLRSVIKCINYIKANAKSECGFSAVNDLLSKKGNRFDITKREDLRLKLTKLKPDVTSLSQT